MTEVSSYPKVYAKGHRSVADLFMGKVVVQEKIDGSQFSFGSYDGKLGMRSRGQQIVPGTEDRNLFGKPVDTALELFDAGMLEDGWTYRCEALVKPRHNTIQYDRAPETGLILFDVDMGIQDHIDDPGDLWATGNVLGLEVTPSLYHGPGPELNDDLLAGWVLQPSFLGGLREGVVIKNYERFGRNGKILVAKVVADAFKEVHQKSWKRRHPSKADIVEEIQKRYRTEARWQKAIQHLRERGELQGAPADIGPLMKEVNVDVLAECEDEIKEILFTHHWKKIARGLTNGLPEWYKAQLSEGDDDE